MAEEEEEGEASPTSGDQSTGPPSDNPWDQMDVVLSIPKTVSVEMVEARNLGDYELWFAISSALLSTTVGLFVSTLDAFGAKPDEPSAGTLAFVTILFTCMTVASAAVTLGRRRRLAKNSQQITFRAGRTSD